MQFQHPQVLIYGLPLLVVIAAFLYIHNKKKEEATVKFSNATFLQTSGIANNIAHNILYKISYLLRLVVVALLLVALAGPYLTDGKEKVLSKGIDIAITLDISDSMDRPDFSPNRLFKARNSIIDFIALRKTDRIGLVLFGKDAYLQCPLTLDHEMLLYFLKLTGIQKEVRQSTAIGTAISTAIIALKNPSTVSAPKINSSPESKIIILVTDGDNTSGEIDPITAAHLAANYDIKIYTIGMGKKKNNLNESQQNLLASALPTFDTQFNEEILKEIAKITGGRYFNVQDDAQMEATYRQIDTLEKSEVEISSLLLTKKAHEQFVMLAFFLFFSELLLRFAFLNIFYGATLKT